jgi:hypothetical protein
VGIEGLSTCMGYVYVNSRSSAVLRAATTSPFTIDYIDGNVENGDIEYNDVDDDSSGRWQCRCRY